MRATTERPQNEMATVASRFRDAVQVTPAADDEDVLPAASMVALPDELLQHIFRQACNALEPRHAVALSSASHGLWAVTQEGRQLLKADHEAAAILCLKMGLRSCKELREAKEVYWYYNEGLYTAADLTLLGTLGSVLPALEGLYLDGLKGLFLHEPAAGPDGVQLLAEKLGAGALPAVTYLSIRHMNVGDAGASALAVALGQGALPRLKSLSLDHAAIGDAGLVALAPALRRRATLELLYLALLDNPFGDEGLTALVVAPPPPAGAPPPPTGGLAMLKRLDLSYTQITDAGCTTLTSALDSGALPALDELYLDGIPASAAAQAAVCTLTAVLAKLKVLFLDSTRITDAGCAALATALDSGALPALEEVALQGIPARAPRRRPPSMRLLASGHTTSRSRSTWYASSRSRAPSRTPISSKANRKR